VSTRAVFLDRDGVINEDLDFVWEAEKLRILPNVGRAIARLNEHGFTVVVVTNQSGVARGMYTLDDVDRFHRALSESLATSGAHIDGYYACPHHPEGTVPEFALTCDCRKPEPGLLHRAQQELDIDLASSYVVGDSARDIEAGRACGCTTVFVGGRVEAARAAPDASAADLLEAVDIILKDSRPGEGARPTEEGEGTDREERVDCSVCGRAVPSEDCEAGAAVERSGSVYCKTCVDKLREAPAPARGGRAEELLERLVEEMVNLRRQLTFEQEFTIWNVLAGAAQVATLFVLFLVALSKIDILWPVLLQLVTLTFVVLGKK